jgi:hypothetical protein
MILLLLLPYDTFKFKMARPQCDTPLVLTICESLWSHLHLKLSYIEDRSYIRVELKGYHICLSPLQNKGAYVPTHHGQITKEGLIYVHRWLKNTFIGTHVCLLLKTRVLAYIYIYIYIYTQVKKNPMYFHNEQMTIKV